MNLTKIAFSIQDRIKGKIISTHYDQIVNFFKNGANSDKALNDILIHASLNVPYYHKVKDLELSKFPVVDKSKIKDEATLFKAKNYLDNKVIAMTTSGSTGTPFTVFQDVNKKARNHADTKYFGELGGYTLGNKLLYLKIWSKIRMSHPLLYKIQNIIPIDVILLSDHEIEDLIKRLENNKNTIFNILAYVSALEHVIRYCTKNNISKIDGNVAGIITMSEGLSKETKEKLKKIFNTSVVSRYSNLENGIMAQQLVSEDRFLVNTASYHIEILDLHSNQEVAQGDLGRIVITDLYNYAMPMIRYDTGDLGSLNVEKGSTYLTKIEGRKLDVLFDTKGHVVSSYIMYKNMWQYNEIAQYQLIQTGEITYVFKINCETEFQREGQLINEFKEFLGSDADFRVEYVKEIPLLDSGKRRKTVNLYKKTID